MAKLQNRCLRMAMCTVVALLVLCSTISGSSAAFAASVVTTQTNASYNLALLNGGADKVADEANLQYTWEFGGRNVTIYTVDQGVDCDFPDIKGRCDIGPSFVNESLTCTAHGTSVASIAVGSEAGVAKAARIVNVKALPCSGAGSELELVRAMTWILENAERPAVINLSLLIVNLQNQPGTARSGDFYSGAFERVVQQAIEGGLAVVAAAGNFKSDACMFSPGRMPDVITVATVDNFMKFGFVSNYGPCVDILAPGTLISAGGTVSTGSSQATPHVSGVIAQLLESDADMSQAELRDALMQMALYGAVSDLPSGTPNVFLQALR